MIKVKDKKNVIKEELERIVDEELVYPVFQPIVDLSSGDVLGYEALSRLKKAEIIKEPETLFKMAGLYSKLWEVEQLCRKKILKQVSKNKEAFADKKVFMNVNPLVMTDGEFKKGFTRKYIEKHDLSVDQIVIEITEHSAATDMKEFQKVVQHYKKQGYLIAVDDAGSCYSGLNLICDVKPYYLKLDIEMIKDICTDAVKCSMVKSFVEFARLTGMKLIAEGIESEEQLKILIQLGVHYGQGYFLCKPDEHPQRISQYALKQIQKVNYKKVYASSSYKGDYRVVIMKIGKHKSLSAYATKYGDDKCKELLAQLEMCIKDYLIENECLKWIEEDSALLVLERVRCDDVCEEIVNNFRNNLRLFYGKDELESGFIISKNKHGKDEKYSIVEPKYEIVI